MAAVQLGDLWGDLPRGISTVTARPAKAVGLSNRGSLCIGQRADVIRFAILDGTPVLQETWSAGSRVF
jgi:alpha-D-ribose 1-methylphosphonate 5-triphosphate diphosphatase